MIEGLLIGLQTVLSIKKFCDGDWWLSNWHIYWNVARSRTHVDYRNNDSIAVSLGDPATALILLAGVYYGAIFGGSTSSILINAPGVASTVATSFDGYPLTRQGW